MGGLGSLFGGSDAGSDAAAVQSGFNEQAISFLKNQLKKTTSRLAPFFRAGKNQVGALEQGATAGGLDARLAEIFNTDTFGALNDERTRAVQGQLSAGGLTRSGTALQEIADVPTRLALQIEELLTGRSRGLANTGLNAANALGGFGANAGSVIAQLLSGSGEAQASGILADEQSSGFGGQNILNTVASIGGAASKAGGLGALASSIFFSDPRLKTDMEPIGAIHDLTLYEWDWKPEFTEIVGEGFGNVGFSADEVQDKYPHHVQEYAGWKHIDYPALLDELEAA